MVTILIVAAVILSNNLIYRLILVLMTSLKDVVALFVPLREVDVFSSWSWFHVNQRNNGVTSKDHRSTIWDSRILTVLFRLCSGISCCRLRKIDFFALAASSFKWSYLLLLLLSPLVLLLRYGSIDYVKHWRSYKLWRLRKTFLLLAIQVLS